MPGTGLWLRVFVSLLLGVIPPILILVAAVLLTDTVFRETDPNVVGVLVVVAAIVWAAILAIVYTRAFSDEMRALIALARLGQTSAGDNGTAYAELAEVLDTRNRQISTLARSSGEVSIDEEPATVAIRIVETVQDVLADPTWRLVVLGSARDELLEPGVYRGPGEGSVEPVGDMERWASVTATDRPARHVEGPWGAFTVVKVSGANLRALLYAPWAGRAVPAPAELALLALVGQHVVTALEHSLLYATLRVQAEELARLSTVQTDFLRGVTHDLQTPLTSIGALATELRADETVPHQAREDLDMITHQADRLRRMVSQLLTASRLEAGALTPRQEVFAVLPILQRTWAALRADRPFQVDVTGEPYLAVGDPDRLEQVLWAVLDNAVKYSPAAAPVEVAVTPETSHLAIKVRDHGFGMDAETRNRAFEQFYRATAARRIAPDGSGVGLYAARGLMEAMGGSIEASAALGRGTQITIRIPGEPATGTGA